MSLAWLKFYKYFVLIFFYISLVSAVVELKGERAKEAPGFIKYIKRDAYDYTTILKTSRRKL